MLPAQLSPEPLPAWLAALTPASIAADPFPLRDVLRGSLYYPACGLDGDPVKYLAGYVHSFVHVDHGQTEHEVVEALSEPGFHGYGLLAKRHLAFREVAPEGWPPLPLQPFDGDPNRGRHCT